MHFFNSTTIQQDRITWFFLEWCNRCNSFKSNTFICKTNSTYVSLKIEKAIGKLSCVILALYKWFFTATVKKNKINVSVFTPAEFQFSLQYIFLNSFNYTFLYNFIVNITINTSNIYLHMHNFYFYYFEITYKNK